MIDLSIPRLPKLAGADIELGNFVLGMPGPDTGALASRALLAEIDGLPRARRVSYTPYSGNWSSHNCWRSKGDSADDIESSYTGGWNSQDWGRKYLPTNGGCAYIDLDHLELCLPEVLSAWDHAAAWHAMLRIAREAMDSANARLPEGRAIQVLVNNSDGQGHSYGSHLNFLVTRRAWENVIRRKPHYLAWLASFQASSIVCTGQGKVGSENGAPDVPFQISQRADYFETLVGPQTTFERPLVNSRDEHLCGTLRWSRGGAAPARLHVIFFDNTLAHRSCVLKVGIMQLALAMMEAERVNPTLILDDALAAVGAYSRDPTLRTSARLATGADATAVELQFMFLEEARRFAAEGGFDGFVPRAAEILDLWEDTLERLRAADWMGLAPKLDWVMKLMILKRAMGQRPSLTWDSPEIRHLDKIYASLDPSGLYWAYERSGFAERLLDEARIRHFCSEPPADSRAWARAMLLRKADPDWVDSVDWDSISFRVRDGGYWPSRRNVDMENPLGMTEAELVPLFEKDGRFTDLLDAIEAAAAGTSATQRPQTVN
ncbi:MAG: proteasome accessory factor PafA2 family protein [Bryobacteraceae bacterium]|jgi:proteasome accessory factor A